MTVSPVAGGGDALARVQRENETLYAVIKTVSSSLDLDRVLDGIVEIATDATGCHACFIYFVDGERLVLRAASPRYSHLVGQLTWGIDEGLTGWVARTKTPEFIRDHALDDPRMKYVPELEEERFQSMVAVPVMARDGDVLGVVVLHTQAPREFDDGVLNFLVHTASLVAGAIDNAKLYEGTRRRVEALTTLTQLSQALAAVTLREDLYDAVTRGARQLLGADSCQIWRIDPEADELNLVGADPPDGLGSPRPADGAHAGRPQRSGRGRARDRAAGGRGRAARPALLHRTRARVRRRGRGAAARRCSPDGGGPEEGGADRAPHGGEHRQGHVRSARRRLGGGGGGEGGGGEVRPQPPPRLPPCRAGGACRTEDGPGWPDVAARLEARLRRLYPRAFFDSRHDCVRAIAPLPTAGAAAVERLRQGCEELARDEGVVVGLSDVDRGAASARRRMREAADAARIGRSLVAEGGAVSYEGLGAYKYLVHLELEDAPHDRYRLSVEELLQYDRRRGARLVETLERFLADRGSVAASARALYIHPNTVRQRLERIERVTGLDLGKEDLLSLELALKLARLHDVRGDRD